MVREIGIGAGDRRVVGREVFGLEQVTIRRQHEARLRPRRGRADLQRRECPPDFAGLAGGDVDVVRLEDAAQIGLVGLALAQTLERGLLILGELLGVEGQLRQRRDGFFDFDRVHSLSPPSAVGARKGSTLIVLARRMTSANS